MLSCADEYVVECLKLNKQYSTKKYKSLLETHDIKSYHTIEVLYSIAKDVEIPLCASCNLNKVKLQSVKKGFRKYCSNECYRNSMSVRNKENNVIFNKQKALELDKKYEEILNSAAKDYAADETTTIKDLSLKYQVSVSRINSYLKKMNIIDKDRQKKIFKRNTDEKFSYQLSMLSNKEWVLDKIKNDKWTSLTFAEELDCSKNYVCEKLRSFDLPLSDFRTYTSSYENKISNVLRNLNVDHKLNDRKILSGKEIDIYIPEKSIGIEINGVYWHQDNEGTKKNYHLNKTIECEKQNIRLIHITDKDIDNKFDIVKSIIYSAIGKSNTIYARNCSIDVIDSKTFFDFTTENHLQGNLNSSIKYGLYHNGALVSVMGFAKPRFNKKYEYELTRFCNLKFTNVVGGATKLFKYFLKSLNPQSIISYCDRGIFTGRVYENMGMTFEHNSPPNYVWINNEGVKLSRYQTQKHLLKETSSMKEDDVMKSLGFMKLYDSGQKVYTYRKI